MLRNIDTLFARVAVNYKFVSREAIKKIIKEISALQVLGIDKRIYQILFERKYLSTDQIYAVFESLIQSGEIRKLKTLITYQFTLEDDKKFYSYLGIKNLDNHGKPKDIKNTLAKLSNKNIPIKTDDLLLCLNIKYNLHKAGIETLLLNIIADKQFLNTGFKKILPNINKKRCIVISSKTRDRIRVNRSIGILYGQIAIINGMLTQDQLTETLFIWQALRDLKIRIKYSELLFYMKLLNEENVCSVAASLENLSNINQYPRFSSIRLNEQEEECFQKLLAKSVFNESIVQTGKDLLLRLRQEGLILARLSDTLILSGALNRKMIMDEFSKIRKHEIKCQVGNMEFDKTQEERVVIENGKNKFFNDIPKTQKITQQNKAEFLQYNHVKKLFKNIILKAKCQDGFQKELSDTFLNTQNKTKQAVTEEIKLWKQELVNADKKEARAISSMINQYEKKSIKIHLIFIVFIILMAFLGFLMAWFYR